MLAVEIIWPPAAGESLDVEFGRLAQQDIQRHVNRADYRTLASDTRSTRSAGRLADNGIQATLALT